MVDIPNAFYRVSIKGLILDENKEKFLVVLEDNGWWELPGGGLDWGEKSTECLKREMFEEMGLTVTEIKKDPSYYLIDKDRRDNWILNIVYEIKVKDLNFTPSKECVEIKFVSPQELESMNAFRTVKELGQLFDKNKHQ
jgi:8-oxo-dGTP diphosphatase